VVDNGVAVGGADKEVKKPGGREGWMWKREEGELSEQSGGIRNGEEGEVRRRAETEEAEICTSTC
jgi:hypothetical protein